MMSHQSIRLILLADQRGHRIEQGARAIPPRLGLDGHARSPQANGGRPVASAHGEPGLVAEQAHRAVAESMTQGREGSTEIERAAQRDAALDHRRIESRIGVGPACASSSSARVRIPR